MEKSTADLSDILHPEVQYLDPVYRSFGNKSYFEGSIVTIKCFEDNSLVKKILNQSGNHQVLVVDAGGSLRCAMLGDNLARTAVQNNWRGIVIYGLIRDSKVINTLSIGVKALGTHPLKTVKKNTGEYNIMVHFSGVIFRPGNYLYSDDDGVIIVEKEFKNDL